MSKEITLEDKKVMTIKFRVSHPHLGEPVEFKNDGKPKYRLTMLFNESDDLSGMKKAVRNAKIEEFGADETKWPKMKSPFRVGNKAKPGDPAYKDKIFVAASAKPDKKPQIVNNDRDLIDASELYAGCYARATLIAFVYEAAKPGVSFALLNVQKLGEGKKFGGKRDAREEFDAVEDQSDFEGEEPSEEEEGDDSDDLGF